MAPIKRFEAFLGNSWQGWEASDTVKIENILDGNSLIQITITMPDGIYKTFFNLDTLPAYTIG